MKGYPQSTSVIGQLPIDCGWAILRELGESKPTRDSP